eukprot:8162902-Pyramimonas_sp.AAC.1
MLTPPYIGQRGVTRYGFQSIATHGVRLARWQDLPQAAEQNPKSQTRPSTTAVNNGQSQISFT